MISLNVILIGSGHYATGTTTISGDKTTDKDFGVFLPSVFKLREIGEVENIYVCGRSGEKLRKIRERFKDFGQKYSLDTTIHCYPDQDLYDESAYLEALKNVPHPKVALIAVPDDLHEEIMMNCANHKVPFLIVKPAVISLDGFYKVSEKLKETGVLGMVDYHKVYDEANMLIKSEYQAGSYGKIQHFSSLMTQRRDMLAIYKRWFKSDSRLNINHYLGSHYIHLVSFITGAIPKTVRCTKQYGVAKSIYGLNTPDTIQTNVEWQLSNGTEFVSYHVSGWADPSETAAMTFQQFHMLTENGHVFSNQRDRGLSKYQCIDGTTTPNPYFFPLYKDHSGKLAVEGKYGFDSIRNFIKLVHDGFKNNIGGMCYPTFLESENVTAVLEASDISLDEGGRVVSIDKTDNRFILS